MVSDDGGRMAFTWFPKLTATVERVPEDRRLELVMAIIGYGTYGEEPELSWPLDAIFASVREDIENSWRARRAGAEGARRRAEGARTSGDGSGEGISDEREAPSKGAARGVEAPSEGAARGDGAPDDAPEGGLEGSEGPSKGGPSNTIPFHTKDTNPIHAKGGEGAKRGRFTPPTRDEAREFAEELGMPASEGDAFVDHFSSNGWKVSGKAPMRDWRASMRNWRRNWAAGSFAPRGEPPRAPAPRPVNAVDPIAEADRLDREYRERFGGEA